MSSILPFQDLNHYPPPQPPLPPPPPPTTTSATSDGATSSTSTTTTTTTPFPLKIPKLEPKLEPLYDDEQPFTPNTPNNTNSNLLFYIQQQQQQQQQNLKFSNSTLVFFSNSQTTPPSQIPPPQQQQLQFQSNGNEEENNVLSEYNRIRDLFQTAMQKQHSDVSVLDPNSEAIIPYDASDAAMAVAVQKPQIKKYPPRSSELVRVLDLRDEDKLYFRELVRHTRMVYDSLRILSVLEEEKRFIAEPETLPHRRYRPRGDLMASALMRDKGLWLNRDKRIVGPIPGIEIGDLFLFRMELCVLGIHGHPQAGIDYLPMSQSSSGEPIATSIIVSGGYEDDVDDGDVIVYTGHGGQDKFSRQCTNQKLEGGNLALERSMHYGIEVRVIRGFKYDGSASSKVYVYDGLYKVVDCWFDIGKSGFGVYKYKLIRIEGQPDMGSLIFKFAQSLKRRPLEVRPKGYLSLDISNRNENVSVFLFNDVDGANVPLCYEYIPRSIFPPYAYGSGSHAIGCDCVEGCQEGCFCAMKNGGEFAYDHHGFLLRGKPVIFECGPFCKCPLTCRNRVTQRGLRHRLEVFRSVGTGWGVRSLDLIHAGSFICEYAGVVLTRQQAEIFSMNGDNLVYPGRFANRWAEWGDLSQVYSDYVCPAYPSIPPVDFAVDVSRMRNVACYMSHSTTPNVIVQYVLYDHNNLMFPHVMLFAVENIPPLREISLDYGMSEECTEEKPTEKLAICN